MKTRMPSAPRVPEKVVQQHVAQLLRAVGAKVYTLGTVRRRGDHPGTMQTPGLPDVIAFLKWPSPARADSRVAGTAEALGLTRQLLIIECKAEDGRLRSEQVEFRGLVMAAGIAHITGGVDDVIAWLVAHGHAKATQFPHYRARVVVQENTNGR